MKKTLTLAALALVAAAASAGERWPGTNSGESTTVKTSVEKFPTFPTFPIFPKFPVEISQDRWPYSISTKTSNEDPKPVKYHPAEK